MGVINELESEFEDHKINTKEAYADYSSCVLKFTEIAKSAAAGEVKDAKLDNSTLYLEYSENSTIDIERSQMEQVEIGRAHV
jgi:hypothetical protein